MAEFVSVQIKNSEETPLVSGGSENRGDRQWFVLRDLKRPNAKLRAYEQLRQRSFEVFTPLVWKTVVRHGKRVRVQVPVIYDLLFVYAVKEALDEIVERTETLQYRYLKGGAYKQPMVVRDQEMERFIRAVESSQTPVYYSPQEITPDMIGRKVRIVGGPLNGQEAFLLKLKGARKKRIIVELHSLVAVGVAVSSDFIEFI